MAKTGKKGRMQRMDSSEDIHTDPWLSPLQAGRALGISRITVMNLAVRGSLVSMVAAGRILISRESVERWKASTAERAS